MSQSESPRQALAFAGAAFAFLTIMLGTTLPTPLYPLYQAAFGFSQLIVTVIFAAYAVGVIAALVITGRWSDQLGRRPLLLAGLTAAILSNLVFLQADSLGALLAGRVLSGISAGIFTGTATVAVVELAPARARGLAPLMATAANMGGLGLGPVVAGLLVRFLPAPLLLPYGLHLALAGLAMLTIWLAPETVSRAPHPQLRLQRLSVPLSVRPVFLPAAVAGFAGFAVLGFFTATAPAFMAEVLGHPDLLSIGLIAGSPFFLSILGQLAQGRLPEAHRLPIGCVVLLVGVGLVGAGIGLASLPLFLAGALAAGFGQGIALRAGLGGVVAASPADQRGEVTSTFFVVGYVALSIPVVGIGLMSQMIGLKATGEGFAALVALLMIAALFLLRRQRTALASSS